MLDKIILTFLVVLVITGCATHGKLLPLEVSFNSVPSGAIVLINKGWLDAESCVTPCYLVVNRGDEVVFQINKKGYENVSQSMEPCLPDETYQIPGSFNPDSTYLIKHRCENFVLVELPRKELKSKE